MVGVVLHPNILNSDDTSGTGSNLLKLTHAQPICSQEGFAVGLAEGRATGFDLGFQRAAQLSSEAGFYAGFAEQLQIRVLRPCPPDASGTLLRHLRRVRPLVTSLARLIDQLPRENSKEADVTYQMNDIRAKFRQLCAVLNVNPIVSDAGKEEISF